MISIRKSMPTNFDIQKLFWYLFWTVIVKWQATIIKKDKVTICNNCENDGSSLLQNRCKRRVFCRGIRRGAWDISIHILQLGAWWNPCGSFYCTWRRQGSRKGTKWNRAMFDEVFLTYGRKRNDRDYMQLLYPLAIRHGNGKFLLMEVLLGHHL